MDSLDLSDNDLRHVCVSQLTSGLANCSQINLGLTELNPFQISGIIEALPQSATRHLDLSYLNCNHVKMDQITTMLNTLTHLSLAGCTLNEGEKLSIFLLFQEKFTLKHLDIGHVPLVTIPADALALAAGALESFRCCHSWLEHEQIEKLLDAVFKKDYLRHLDISGNSFKTKAAGQTLLLATRTLRQLTIEKTDVTEATLNELLARTEKNEPPFTLTIKSNSCLQI